MAGSRVTGLKVCYLTHPRACSISDALVQSTANAMQHNMRKQQSTDERAWPVGDSLFASKCLWHIKSMKHTTLDTASAVLALEMPNPSC